MRVGGAQVVARLPERGIRGYAEVARTALVVDAEIDHGQRRVGASVVGIQPNCLLEERDRSREIVGRRPLVVHPALQERVVGCRYVGLLPAEREIFGLGELHRQCIGNAPRHPILQREDVGKRAIELACPFVAAAQRVDQLYVDTQPVTGALDTAFEHVAHTERLRYLLQAGSTR